MYILVVVNTWVLADPSDTPLTPTSSYPGLENWPGVGAGLEVSGGGRGGRPHIHSTPHFLGLTVNLDEEISIMAAEGEGLEKGGHGKRPLWIKYEITSG